MAEAITRKAFVAGAGAVAVGAALVAAGCGGGGEPELGAQLVARKVAGPLPVSDPTSDAWTGEGETLLQLTAQTIARPGLTAASVPEVRVAALHDGDTLAFRASWAEDAAAQIDGLGQFHDALAVMLPGASREAPPITMGGPGKPVHLMQWRGSWQLDVDDGKRVSVEQIYPNVVHDLLPAQILPPKTAVLWTPGRAVGNPMSALREGSPVEDVIAEGFGSTTHAPVQTATGRGVFTDGRWWVTVATPMKRGSGLVDIMGGLYWPVAFAVWSGTAGNRGGRKQYTPWASMLVEA